MYVLGIETSCDETAAAVVGPEGVLSTVAVSGDRKMTTSGDNSGQIIDLREEKIYDLDIRRKTYKVTTFEELRRQMREAEARARESASKEPSSEQPSKNEGKEMEVDFDVKNTGQTTILSVAGME